MTSRKRATLLAIAATGLAIAVTGTTMFVTAYGENDRQLVEDWGPAGSIVHRPINLATAILMERGANATPLVTINVAVGDLRGERRHAIRRIAARVSEEPNTTVGQPTYKQVLVVIPDAYFDCLAQLDDRAGADRQQAIDWTRKASPPTCRPGDDDQVEASTAVQIRAYTATGVHAGLRRRVYGGFAAIVGGGFVLAIPILLIVAASPLATALDGHPLVARRPEPTLRRSPGSARSY